MASHKSVVNVGVLEDCRRLRFDWEERGAAARLAARPASFPSREIPLRLVAILRISDLFSTMTFAFCIRGSLGNHHSTKEFPVCSKNLKRTGLSERTGRAADDRLKFAGLLVQHDGEQRLIDLDFAVVFDETQFPKLVHEKIDAGTRGSDHARQGLLRNSWQCAHGLILFSVAREK